MRTAHPAAAHNRWLAAEIQQSLDDPRPSLQQHEVMAAMEAEIDAEVDAIERQRVAPTRAKGA